MKLVLVLVLSFVSLQFLVRPNSVDYTKVTPKVIPPKTLKYFTFGYHETAADSLWIRVIQNFDFCKNRTQDYSKANVSRGEKSGVLPEKSSIDDFAPIEQIEKNERKAHCENGWVYQMLDRVTDLSPRFLAAYTMGASTLSIVIDDDKGASAIYSKGLKVFPEHWSMALRAAYHEMYEMKDLAKAANYLYMAGQNGAPLWVQNLASKLYERSGQILLGRAALLDLLERVKGNPQLEKKARRRLKKMDQIWNQQRRKGK